MSGDNRPSRTLRFIDVAGEIPPEAREQLLALVRRLPDGHPFELLVQVVATVPGRRFRDQAVASRHEHSVNPDRSLIVVVSRDDRHVELATAPCWAGRFSEAESHALLATRFVPAMKAGDLPRALGETIRAIVARLDGPPVRPARSPAVAVGIGVGLAVLLGVCGVLFTFVRNHTCRECRGWCDYSERELVAATYTSEGRSEVHFHCGKCGADYTEIRSIPVRSSSSDSSGSSSDSGSDSSSDGGGGADW
jgi:uncharacterized membrane protein YgcG